MFINRFLLNKKKNNQFADLEFVKRLESTNDLLGLSKIGYIYFDVSGEILQINHQALKELSIGEKDLTGENVFQLLNLFYKNNEILQDIINKLRESAPSVILGNDVYVRALKLNEKFYIKGQFHGQYYKGRLSHILFSFRNVERDLTQEYILNMALSRTKIFPWFFNMDKNKMMIDSRWFTHLDIPQGDCTLTSEEFAAMVHENDREMLMTALATQLSGNLIPDTFAYRLRRGDGTWEWFEEKSIYLGQVNGLPYRVVGVCQSIQRHKNIEENLVRARDKARESDKLKSAFLANMSHEIRTPLNAIVGFSNLLASDEFALEDEEREEYARLINANSEQLLMLISDILDLSKIESNTMEFNYLQVNLNDLFSDVYQSQELHVGSSVKLKMEIPEISHIIKIDPLRFKQVLNNLINNAIKFTTEGSISFGYGIKEDRNSVEVFVSDTGKGIVADKLEHIFERFYKVDSFAKGVGLGLSICKTIMENMGGTIEVTSKVNEGTCFIMHLPLKYKLMFIIEY